jgi:hypothetical protein
MKTLVIPMAKVSFCRLDIMEVSRYIVIGFTR